MTSELMKSIRAVKACDVHHAGIPHGPESGDSTAIDHPWCDNCLRLVLAQCEQVAVEAIAETKTHAWLGGVSTPVITHVAAVDAIRRALGTTA